MAQQNFLNRCFEYLNTTHVELSFTARHKDFSDFLKQDLRGFAPNLRKIFLYKNQSANFKTDNWLLHDLMHIIFYDYATYFLGIECWQDYERFIECHLASEAFAVLCLDYHYLVDRNAAITVDLTPSIFKNAKGIPHYKSYEFCSDLVTLYLTGTNSWLQSSMHKHSNEDIQKWLGHEIRYSQKQRIYTQMWWEDLNLTGAQNIQEALVHDSYVAEAIFDVIELIHNGSEKEWKNFMSQIKELSHSYAQNYFSSLPKEKNFDTLKSYDFRFTQWNSLSDSMRKHDFSLQPTASDLFLLWQLLSQFSLDSYTSLEQKVIKNLHSEANHQVNKISNETWEQVVKWVSNKPLFHLKSSEKNLFFLP